MPRFETGLMTEASSAVTPFTTMPTFLFLGLAEEERDDRFQVGEGVATSSRCGWGGVKCAISGANVLSKPI